MANAHTKVTKGARSVEDRGSPSRAGHPGRPEEVRVPAVVAVRSQFEHTLQSKKTGLIVQLTAPHDRYNELSGVRVKARPLTLNFTAHGGFVKLNLQNAEDRRRWLYVVGSKIAEDEFAKLKLEYKRAPEDGTDEIEPHPRFGLGRSFWKLSDMTRQTAEMKRKTLLDQLASDPELAKFVIENPEELTVALKKRAAKLAPAPAAAPAAEAGVGESAEDEAVDSSVV